MIPSHLDSVLLLTDSISDAVAHIVRLGTPGGHP